MFVLRYAYLLFAISSYLVAETNPNDSLKGTLNERAKVSNANIDAETKSIFAKGIEDIKKSGITNQAPKVGEDFPLFSLPDSGGEKVNLESLLKKGPVVVTFYRGGWCPYCNIQLAFYQSKLDEFTKRGASIVAISPEVPTAAEVTSTKHKITFPILSDVNNDFARRLGIVFELDEALRDKYLQFNIPMVNKKEAEGIYELPLAATFVLDTNGKVVWSFVKSDYTERAEPSAIFEALEKLY